MTGKFLIQKPWPPFVHGEKRFDLLRALRIVDEAKRPSPFFNFERGVEYRRR